MVDNVDLGVESGDDTALGDDMAADLFAAFMSGVGRGLHLVERHRHDVGRPGKPVPAGRIQLDHIDAMLDLLAHRLAELVGSVADTSQSLHLKFPPTWMEIDRIAGSHDV